MVGSAPARCRRPTAIATGRTDARAIGRLGGSPTSGPGGARALGRVGGEAAVHRSRLDDGAARCLEEAEPHAEVLAGAARPSASSPRHTPADELERPHTAARSTPGSRAVSRSSSTCHAASRKPASSQYRTTPTLTNSSRSTRGTHAARRTGTAASIRRAHAPPPAARAGARRAVGAPQEGDVRRAQLGRGRRAGHRLSHPSGTSATTSVSTVVGQRGRELGVEPGDRADGSARARARDASYGWAAKRSAAPTPRSSRGGSRARHRGRSARAAVPDQQVGVAPGPVDVGDEGVQPEQPAGEVRA